VSEVPIVSSWTLTCRCLIVMEIDTFGTFHASTAAFQYLKAAAAERGDACILNITAEFFAPPFFAGHAAAAKMAVDSLTRSHSMEWSDYGIRVNGIAPGPIADTPGYDKLAGMGGGDPTLTGTTKEAVKLPRGLMAGLTWDIGMAAVFYCSTAGGFVSGDIMRVDGGGHFRKGVTYPVQRDLVKQLSGAREKEQKKKPTGVAGAADGRRSSKL
jgi:peroxisomal 2,4-dienoyl-CoA reductase